MNDEIVIYKSKDGVIKLDVLFSSETVWLTQEQMTTLFQRDKSVISRHINNIYEEGELSREATVANFATVQIEGRREVSRDVNYYNLDVVISVGYRVKSPQGTQFRIWATQRLRDYIIKGFALNDERFKSGNSMNYFKELLERIREIRVEERFFYQQIKDIYRLSIDYDPDAQITKDFFCEVQNKLLWAVSGQTAAELRYYRADHQLPMMGLTTTSKPGIVRKDDTLYGKNFLKEQELTNLKLIVEQYLAFAETQAVNQRPMYMKDWVEQLRLILTMNRFNILEHKGKISKSLADKKTSQEYMAYKNEQKRLQHIESLKELEADIKKLKVSKKK